MEMMELFWHFLADNSGWMVAIITLVVVIKQDRGVSKQEHDASIRASQKMADSLSHLTADVQGMQATLARIADREDAYGKRLTECTARISDHEKRISRIENRCDERRN